mmetsp:Transcript_41900/g.103327  ORF Transcript_41900/g.103327 Transcript_41900/m.103327 type:complete len:230 (+) Transcript_41900:501-1190(+)
MSSLCPLCSIGAATMSETAPPSRQVTRESLTSTTVHFVTTSSGISSSTSRCSMPSKCSMPAILTNPAPLSVMSVPPARDPVAGNTECTSKRESTFVALPLTNAEPNVCLHTTGWPPDTSAGVGEARGSQHVSSSSARVRSVHVLPPMVTSSKSEAFTTPKPEPLSVMVDESAADTLKGVTELTTGVSFEFWEKNARTTSPVDGGCSAVRLSVVVATPVAGTSRATPVHP